MPVALCVFVAVNLSDVVRISANYYLAQEQSQYQLEIEALEFKEVSAGVIDIAYLFVKQVGKQDVNRLELTDLRLSIDTDKLYWLSDIVLFNGDLTLNMDELMSQVGITGTDAPSAPVDVNELYRSVIDTLLDNESNKEANNESQLPAVTVKNFTAKLLSPAKALTNNLSLHDAALSFTADPQITMNIKLNQQFLLTVQAQLEEQNVTGVFNTDLEILNQFANSYFEFPLAVKGKLSSDYVLSSQDNSLSWHSVNTLANADLDLSFITGKTSGFLVNGQFETKFANSVLSLKTSASLTDSANAATNAAKAIRTTNNGNASSKFTIKPDIETLTELQQKLEIMELPVQLKQLLADNLPLTLTLLSENIIILDLNKNHLSGKLQLLSQGEMGEITLALPDFFLSEASSEIDWQLSYQQQQPVEQLGLVKLNLDGSFFTDTVQTNMTLNSGSQLLLTDLYPGPVSIDSVAVELTAPALFDLQAGDIHLSETLQLSSAIEQVSGEQFNLVLLNGQHQLQQQADTFLLKSQWLVDQTISLNSEHKFEQQQLIGKVNVEAIPLTEFFPWLPVPELLTVADAQISNEINYKIDLTDYQLTASVDGHLENGVGHYDDIHFSDVNSRWHCLWQSAQLSCDEWQLSSGMFNAGVAIADFSSKGSFLWQDKHWFLGVLTLKGDVLDGSFILENLDIFADKPFSGTLALSHLSLAELVALQQQPGIEVTGFIDGQLPFVYTEQGLSIEQGKLLNQAPGIIRVDGNPAVEQLKQAQPALKFALDALKNLQYQHLGSEVTMSPDGETQIKMSIQGKGAGIERPIHFNYQHDENLIQLLRSLRIDTQLSEKIEQSFNE